MLTSSALFFWSSLWKLPFATLMWQTHFWREWSWYLLTMTQLQQTLSSIISGQTLHSIDFSYSIIPVQTMLENEEVRATCFKRDFIKKFPMDVSNHVMFIRTIKIMWVLIDNIDNGNGGFIAMMYGGHPGHYWSGLLEKAHYMAIGHFSSHDRSVYLI